MRKSNSCWKTSLLVQGAKVISLFSAKEVLWLIGLIVGLWIAVAAGCWCFGSVGFPDCCVRSFGILFDVSKSAGPVSMSWRCVGKILVFFIVWLLGGGVLISAMVYQYDKIRDCDFRLPAWMLKHLDHVVILGWNSSVLSFLRREQEQDQGCLFVILTTSDAKLIKTVLDDIKGVHYLIYCCAYDDESERTDHLKLMSEKLKAVYVAGEGQLSVYDTRAYLLAEYLAQPDNLADRCRLYCDIHDFGLASESICQTKKNGKPIYVNFYQRWADCICADIDFNRPLYVAGFGAMGKAVARAALQRHPRLRVFVSDADAEKLSQEKHRFEDQFHKEGRRIVDLHWDAFRKAVADAYPKTVVVALHRSEKGLLCLMELIKESRATCDDLRCYLDQEIDGPLGKELPPINCAGYPVRLFGMKRGAQWNYRNPLTPLLRRFAAECGNELVEKCRARGIAGTRWVLGGSLAYGAALIGCNDIDLRLLIPGGWTDPAVRGEIDRVRDLLTELHSRNPTFRTRMIDEGGTNYIQHAKCIVRMDGISDDVELSWNVQASESYEGLGEIAARLPQSILDRYVVAKWSSSQRGAVEYDALKKEWRSFLLRLIACGARNLSDGELAQLLHDRRTQVPSFLYEKA